MSRHEQCGPRPTRLRNLGLAAVYSLHRYDLAGRSLPESNALIASVQRPGATADVPQDDASSDLRVDPVRFDDAIAIAKRLARRARSAIQ